MNTDRKPCIDLTQRKWLRTVGEFTVYGTWYRHDNGESEPCLVIVSSIGMIGKPAVILLSNAYLYEQPRKAAHIVRRLALGMGKESMSQAVKLADLINDHLSDLISMPPDPRERIVVADATVKLGDGATRSIELME